MREKEGEEEGGWSFLSWFAHATQHILRLNQARPPKKNQGRKEHQVPQPAFSYHDRGPPQNHGGIASGRSSHRRLMATLPAEGLRGHHLPQVAGCPLK